METTFIAALGQYGPLALIAGALLFVNWKHQAQMAERLSKLETEMTEIIKNNTAAMTTLASTIRGTLFIQDTPDARKKLEAAGFLRDAS
jgi:hypothetical protein